MWIPWNLVRNPLVPSVPLEGSDTVQGLRTLERLRAADLLSHSGDADEKRKTKRASRRSRYQRYKGPFIEYLGVDALTQGDGKPWKEFGGQQVGRREMDGRCFDVSGSLDLLAERIDENLVYYAGNYMRMSLVILVLMTYLRPRSIVGIVVLGYTMYSNYSNIVAAAALGESHREETNSNSNNRTLAMGLLTWVAMIYSKCMPIISLALLVSLGGVMLHASLRRAPSEMRYKGRRPISYSFESVVRGLPRDSRRVYRELVSETGAYVLHLGVAGKRWLTYYVLYVKEYIHACMHAWGGRVSE